MRTPQICIIGILGAVAVFHPVHGFFCGPASHIDTYQWLSSGFTAELYEICCAELVAF